MNAMITKIRFNLGVALSLFVASFMLLAIATMGPVYADNHTPADIACQGIQNAGNASCGNADGNQALLNDTVKNIINLMLYAVGIIAVIVLIIGAIRYVVSGGDQKAVSSAKDTILYAIIGIVVAFMAFAIVNFVLGRIDT